MTPFFSIVIPVYNVAPHLHECLDSVLAQSFTDWECICVNDGSIDESGAILDEYAAKDVRFHALHQLNAGEGGARNAGLAMAKGEWLFFLDGDDVMLEGALTKLNDVLTADACLIRFAFCSFEDGNKPVPSRSKDSASVRIVDISHDIEMSEFHTYVWQHIYRRTLINGMRFKTYRRGCDRVFLDEVLLNRVDAVEVVDVICYGYRLRAGSAMRSKPSIDVLRDEMNHRLDIMEMIDASGKHVDYAGHYWLEGYFTHTLPMLSLARPGDARAIVKEWRMRLPRLLQCQGLSSWGRRRIALSSSRLFRPVGDLLIFTLPDLRNRIALVKPLARLYRRLLRHGEFSQREKP